MSFHSTTWCDDCEEWHKTSICDKVSKLEKETLLLKMEVSKLKRSISTLMRLRK